MQFLECLYDSLAAARHYGAVDPDRFRICHFSLQSNHIHILGEAESEADLAAGMHALQIRLSKNFNKLLGTSGTLFPERYHVELLRTPLSPPRSWLLSTGWRKADLDFPHWLDIPFGRGSQS